MPCLSKLANDLQLHQICDRDKVAAATASWLHRLPLTMAHRLRVLLPCTEKNIPSRDYLPAKRSRFLELKVYRYG
jgi:hypothetical protein